MVLKNVRIINVALKVSLLITWHFSQRFFAIAHSVCFEVSLGYNINAIFITEVIPSGVIRIVTCAHSINVMLLHDANVLQHAINTYHISTIGVHFMTVNSLNEYRLTIYQELRVLYLYLSEANILFQTLQHLVTIL